MDTSSEGQGWTNAGSTVSSDMEASAISHAVSLAGDDFLEIQEAPQVCSKKNHSIYLMIYSDSTVCVLFWWLYGCVLLPGGLRPGTPHE